MAGMYDDDDCVPTVSHQIARIYEHETKARLYAGHMMAGQAMAHKADVIDAIRRVIDRRGELEDGEILLFDEADAMSYAALQDEIGRLIHDEEE